MKLLKYLLFLPSLTFGQSADYFQQEVHYQIAVSLDDETHSLTGTVDLQYFNHSPDSLPFLYFHLWPNAYKNKNTAFAQQALRLGNTDFYFAGKEALGGYSALDFQAGEENLQWEFDPGHIDIAKVWLPTVLMPGDSLRIRIPFQLKIPSSFSRLGHVDQSYQITQWYPKPAVYDRDGWHPMPYLDLGEFYSEFGSFDVQITLPSNYVVGATGVLQTTAEREFLLQKVKETEAYLDGPLGKGKDTIPASSQIRKTIRYRAESVHDFAWFADKRFHVMRGSAELPSGREIETWTMFHGQEEELWQHALDYVNRSLFYFSESIGEYPYPQMTAVQSALSAGGGMEYPMITIIDQSYVDEFLHETILHEVGHNWFYGILAFNERDQPWMDEGLNTYYQYRYGIDLRPYLPAFTLSKTDMSISEWEYLQLARRRLDQAPATTSDELSEPNYWLGAYDKPAWAFRYLEALLGTEEFDRSMQRFFEEWKFKHPAPEDLRNHLERETTRELGWFFDGLIGSTAKVDYVVKELSPGKDSIRLTVRNKGSLEAPFPLAAFKEDSLIALQWYEGFSGQQFVSFPAGDYERLVLDPGRHLPELFRHNNQIKTKGLFPKAEPIRILPGLGLGSAQKTNLYLLPGILWNHYDKTQLGILLYNYWQLEQPFEFVLFPVVSTVNGKLNGLLDLRYNFYPASLRKLSLGFNAKTFHFNYNWKDGYYLKYARLSPSIQIDLRSPLKSHFRHSLGARFLWVLEESARFDMEGMFKGKDWVPNTAQQLYYQAGDRRALHPYSFRLQLERLNYDIGFGSPDSYAKLSLELRAGLTYDAKRNIDVRVFAGGFVQNSRRNSGAIFAGAFNLTAQGYQSYDDDTYEEVYFGRNDQSGPFSQQISLRDGGFKNAFSDAFRTQSGNSNNYLIALNLKTDLPQDLPGKLPLKPYFDLAYSDDARPTASDKTFADQLWWSGGLCLDFGNGIFGIYFPLIHSQNIRDLYAQDGRKSYLERITFQLDLKRLNLLQSREERDQW